MTARTIQWIADTGLLVGLTTIGQFSTGTPVLAALSLSVTGFTLGIPTSGAVLGAAPGSAIVASGLPAGLTVAAAGWAYDGSGLAGSYTIFLTETLIGSANSPRISSIAVVIAAAGGSLNFSQPANSGVIAAIRSF